MKRGERIAERTRSAIKTALLELVNEINYPDITVGDITQRGDVGRSTFYRHYRSKADVLIDIHGGIFTRLFSGYSTAESWLGPEAPPEPLSFLEHFQRKGRNPFLLSYKLGNDLDYLISGIQGQLTSVIENRLRDSYAQGDFSIPPAIVAQAVSASYSGLITSWFTRFQSYDAVEFAYHIHRIAGALVREAIRQGR